VERLCAGQAVRIGLGDGSATFKTFAEKWTKGELHQLYPDHIKAKRSVEDDKYRLNKLYDVIGDVPLTKFSLDDAERAMRLLPDGLSSASRRQYAQLMHRVLTMAVFPARIISANPLPRGFLPSGKSSRPSRICIRPRMRSCSAPLARPLPNRKPRARACRSATASFMVSLRAKACGPAKRRSSCGATSPGPTTAPLP
jgi:hypothetical protein